MKFLYYTNIGVLSYSFVVFSGTIKNYSYHPSAFYFSLVFLFLVLLAGLIPYKIRGKNPYVVEFGIILFAIILGVFSWF